MNLPEIFLNWQSLALALGIYAATEGARRFVQSLWKTWKKSTFYTEFVLWVLPCVIGATIGMFVPSFPWPLALTTPASRVFYAVAIGLFSGVVYNRAKWYVTSSKTPTADEKGG